MVLNNNKNCKNGGAYLQKHILWRALIRKGAPIGRRALNGIITVSDAVRYLSIFPSTSYNFVRQNRKSIPLRESSTERVTAETDF